ncbi:MAG: NAD(P)-dependent glycerol-3-phosphate dehydrogenase [Rhodospirillales bacterium]|nr:NAD(P)-dependent glycerol-3-phosphate dehydrogenase [Rhodospirillales bacterium]
MSDPIQNPVKKIGVLGAGAWGSALACVAARAGCEVTLWAHKQELAEIIGLTHTNPDYLPGVDLDQNIHATHDIEQAIDADAVLIVTPAQAMRDVTKDLADVWKPGVPAILCSKGIERDTLKFMNEVCAETLPQAPVAVLSGPTFAGEVARGLPAAATLATEDAALQETLCDALSTSHFRLYRSADVIGSEIGGVVKNVLAIACGIADGRGLGDNARAALITRGLAEIIRLGLAMGGIRETFRGLSGIGDLTLTCNALQSRNFSLGVALGKGESLQDILNSRIIVAEGVFSAAALCKLAEQKNIDMPICKATDQILNEGADINATISELLARPTTSEHL